MSNPLDLPVSRPDAPEQRPANYYRLLGLREFESNLTRIRSAADAAIARLDGLAHTEPDVRQQLVDELTLARLCLTNPARKRQYDEQLREQIIEGDGEPVADSSQSAAAETRAATRDRPAIAGDPEPASYGDAVDYRPSDLLPPTGIATANAPGAAAAPTAFRPTAIAAAPLARPVVAPPPLASVAPPLAVPVAPSTATVGVFSAAPTPHDSALADELALPAPGRRRAARSPSAAAGPGLAIAAIAVIAILIVLAIKNQAERQQASRTATGDRPTGTPAPVDESRSADVRPATTPRNEPRFGPDAVDRPPATGGAQSNAAQPPPQPPKQSSPAQSAGHDAPPQVDAEKSAAFAQALGAARAALGARDFARARRELKSAESLAQTQADATKLTGMETLADAVDNFWRAVGKGLAGLNAADELPVGGTIVAVVEVGSAAITIRAEGANRSYTIESMPAWLATLLAGRWLDERAGSSHVFLGAFQAVDPGGSLAEARRFWSNAKARGESVADLLPLLDEATTALPSERGPSPSAKDVNLAIKGIKARFPAAYRQAARSRDAKRELAETLLTAAGGTADAAERFALFCEARESAVGAADAALVARVIEGWGQWYEIDATRERLDSLKKVVNTVDADGAKSATRVLLDLAERAAADGQSAAAAQFSRLASNAARKSRDAELVDEAARREQQLRSADSAP